MAFYAIIFYFNTVVKATLSNQPNSRPVEFKRLNSALSGDNQTSDMVLLLHEAVLVCSSSTACDSFNQSSTSDCIVEVGLWVVCVEGCWSRAVLVPGGITASAGCGCSRCRNESRTRMNAVPWSSVSSVLIKTKGGCQNETLDCGQV